MMKRLPPTRSAASAIALCAALLLASRPASPQTAPASPELSQILQRLGDVAQTLEHSLPSFTCIESGVSELYKKKKVKKRVRFTATLRDPGAGQHESFTLTEINGKPHSKPGYSFPFFSEGGFSSALAYFLPARQPCYVYSLSPGRIEFDTIPDAASHPPCRAEGVHGFALLDTDGNVTHVERSVPAQSTHDFNLTPFAAIDFALVELNGHPYRLSQHIVSELYEDNDTRRFEATYSGCKLFTASVTILPGTQVVPNPTPPSQ
jgi:hypothetical protein